MTPFDLLWLFLILSSLQPMFQQRVLTARRVHTLRTLERRNGSRAITLIHRRENFSFLGIPFGGFIDIDDSEAVIRAIEFTSKELPIDLVLHTPGGLVPAAEQIAAALADRPAPVTVYVPHYAMSGGTLIALAADQIVVAPSAVLGPVDPQLGEYPAASILAAGLAQPFRHSELRVSCCSGSSLCPLSSRARHARHSRGTAPHSPRPGRGNSRMELAGLRTVYGSTVR